MFVCGAQAADRIKAGNNDALNLGSSWTGSLVPGTDDWAVYQETGTARTNALGADLSWAGIVLDGNTKSWSISAGNNTLDLGAGGIDMSNAGSNLTVASPVNLGAVQTWRVGASRVLTVSGVISGGNGSAFIKEGAGTLTLAGSNIFSGGVTVNAGSLAANGNQALGNGTLTLNNGAAYSSAASVQANNVVINGDVTINGNHDATGQLSGSGNLTHGSFGAFKLVLRGDNSGFSGNITNIATISVAHRNALGTGTLFMIDASGEHSALAANENLLGHDAIANSIVLLNTARIGANNSTGDFELKGVISGSGGLIVSHPLVTVTLSGENTYRGPTDISGGLIVNGSLQSSLITAASGSILSGTGTVQSVVMEAGSMLAVGGDSVGSETFKSNLSLAANATGTMTFHGSLTLAAGSTTRLRVNGPNSYDVLKGVGTNTLTLSGGSKIVLDFLNFDTVAAGSTFPVLQMFQTWGSVTRGAGIVVEAIGLPGGLALDTTSFASSGTVTVVATTVLPSTLPDQFPITMTYHVHSSTMENDLARFTPVQIMGSAGPENYVSAHAAAPDKILLKQDAWGGDMSLNRGAIYPGHLLLKTGTTLSANATATDTVIYVSDYTRIATTQSQIDTGNANGMPFYLLLYKLDANGNPDWSQAEHVILTGINPDHSFIVKRAQLGSTPLAVTGGQARLAKHMEFWDGQWQLNFSLQCPRGGPLNLTAAEWYARQIKSLVDNLDADGVEFDVARWQWGSLGNNPMDCNNDLVTDFGYIDGVCSFGLGGQVFLKELRRLLGPGKVIQMDSNDSNQQRGWQYVNGVQLESFPSANDFSTFSRAFLHMRQWVERAEASPAFSYGYVKTTTTTFGNVYENGENVDWHFRVGFAAGLLTGMPSPFTVVANLNFDPGDPDAGQQLGTVVDLFQWDEYVGGALNDWQWLGRASGAAVQTPDNPGGNMLSGATWGWTTESGFTAATSVSGGEYSTKITALASVASVLPVDTTKYFSGTTIPKTLAFGNRLQIISGAPAMVAGQEYTIEFEAKGNDHWDYAAQSFDKVPRMVAVKTPQSNGNANGGQMTVLVGGTNWKSYRLSFVASANSSQLAFGCSEQIGTVSIRNIRLFAGGAERWSREFEHGRVFLNMTKTPWVVNVAARSYRRLSGTQSPMINNGADVPANTTVTVPAWDAVFLYSPAQPAIDLQPVDVSAVLGQSITLTTSVSGYPAPVLQWQKDGVDITGATGTSLTIGAADRASAGVYTLVATNSEGTVTSNAAVVTVELVNTWIQLLSGNASGTWIAAANWRYNSIGNGADVTADFSTLDLTTTGVVTLDGPRTIGHLKFGDAAGTQRSSWVLERGAGDPLTLAVGAGTPTITTTDVNAAAVNNANISTRINTILSGTSGLRKQGQGQLILGGASNPLSGNVTVAEGVFGVSTNSDSLPNITGVTVQSGAQFMLGDYSGSNHTISFGRPLTIVGTGAGVGALFFRGNKGTGIFTGPITLAGSARIGIYGSIVTNRIQGGLAGTGDLTLHGRGASSSHTSLFRIESPFAHDGDTILTSSSSQLTVQLEGAGFLPTGKPLRLEPSDAVGFTAFKLNGFDQTLGGLTSSATGTSRVINGAATAATLTLDDAGNRTFSGVLGGSNPNDNNFSVVKQGGGSWILSGTNSHAGNTIVGGGILVLGASEVIPNGPEKGGVTLIGALDLNGFSETINGLDGTGPVTGSGNLTVSGVHRPGASLGTQAISGTLVYGSASHLEWELAANSAAGAGTSFDQVIAARVVVAAGAMLDVRLSGPGSSVNFTDPFWSQPHAWPVLTASSLTGSFTLGSVSNDYTGRSSTAYGAFSLDPTDAGVSLMWTPASPFQRWQAARFDADWNNPAIAGDTADPDWDGLANLFEYALGEDPNAFTGLPAASVTGDRLTLHFTRDASATDVTLTVQGADSLSGFWTDLARSTGGAPMVPLVAGATATETGGPTVLAVQVQDAITISDRSHPRRFIRLHGFR